MRGKRLILTMIFLWMLSASAMASEGDTLDSYMEELNLEEIQQNIQELFPDTRFDLRESLYGLIKGESPVTPEQVSGLLKKAILAEVGSQKNILIQMMILAVASAVFSSFVRIFEESQLSEIAFYVIYLLMFVILMRAFSELSAMAADNLGQTLHFMKLLLPVYLVVASLAAGSVTAAGFYELTLVLITGAQNLIAGVVLPGIRLYVLFLLINNLAREEYLSRLADLVRLVLSWMLKTLLALVVGIQTVQSLLLPAIDSLKNSVWTRATGAVPVLGNTLSAVTETVLGTAVLLKNAVGVAGMILIAMICLAPAARLAVCTLLYKGAAATIQPVADKRITGCISAVGEGAAMLLKTIGVTAVMLLLTLAMVTASIRGM